MITVIIPTYRRPQLLKKAINSVLNQTSSDFQICVYDNASNDETEAIVQEFVKNDPRVNYHRHNQNIGMMGNYQFAYNRINTPFFSFLSDDDFMSPWFLETALNQLKQYPEAAFSACGVLYINEKNEKSGSDSLNSWKKEGLYSSNEALTEMLDGFPKFPNPAGILFRYDVVKNISPFWDNDIQLLWDPDYLLQITSSFPIVITKSSCVYALTHKDSFSNNIYSSISTSKNHKIIFFKAMSTLINRLIANPQISMEFKNNKIPNFINCVSHSIALVAISQGLKITKLRKFVAIKDTLDIFKDIYTFNPHFKPKLIIKIGRFFIYMFQYSVFQMIAPTLVGMTVLVFNCLRKAKKMFIHYRSSSNPTQKFDSIASIDNNKNLEKASSES